MKKLLLTTLATFMLTSTFAMAEPEKPAYDKHDGFIVDKHGECVRTKWMKADDPCNPTPPPPPPAPKPVVVAPAPKVSLEQRTVYFDFDSAELTADATSKLNNLSQIINNSSAIRDVQIVGFTDQFGSDSYNMALSKRRVKSVEDYLDQRSRLDTQAADIRGLGKAPKTGCDSVKGREDKIACMQKERRVEIEFKFQEAR